MRPISEFGIRVAAGGTVGGADVQRDHRLDHEAAAALVGQRADLRNVGAERGEDERALAAHAVAAGRGEHGW